MPARLRLKAPPGEPIFLLNDKADGYAVNAYGKIALSCYTLWDESGVELITDPNPGTALKCIGAIVPAKWPPGFTGRRVGSEVVVLDPDQNVVATTGRRYQIHWVSNANRQMGDVICEAVPAQTPAQ